MTEHQDDTAAALAAARAQADTLQRALDTARANADQRLIRAELKAEAIRAGIVDVEGLRLLDLSTARLTETGEVAGAHELIARFRRAKPWLFAPSNAASSSTAQPPRPEPPREKPALAMGEAEYRTARAALLRRP